MYMYIMYCTCYIHVCTYMYVCTCMYIQYMYSTCICIRAHDTYCICTCRYSIVDHDYSNLYCSFLLKVNPKKGV